MAWNRAYAPPPHPRLSARGMPIVGHSRLNGEGIERSTIEARFPLGLRIAPTLRQVRVRGIQGGQRVERQAAYLSGVVNRLTVKQDRQAAVYQGATVNPLDGGCR